MEGLDEAVEGLGADPTADTRAPAGQRWLRTRCVVAGPPPGPMPVARTPPGTAGLSVGRMPVRAGATRQALGATRSRLRPWRTVAEAVNVVGAVVAISSIVSSAGVERQQEPGAGVQANQLGSGEPGYVRRAMPAKVSVRLRPMVRAGWRSWWRR